MKKPWWKTALRWAGRLILAIFIFLAGYLLFALVLGLIPVNRQFEPVDEGVTIFLSSNGVHTDIVVPTESPYYNWRDLFPDEAFIAQVGQAPYLGIGWGDKGFYLETPTWAELKPSVAFRAAFVPSPTAMHVTYHLQKPIPGEKCRRITISVTQYRELIEYILSSFQKDKDRFMLIPNKGYGKTDNFYEAKGAYNMIKTCNMWVVGGLKRIRVRTALWSPFDKGLLYQLRGREYE
jgi:uncharacterized protein (TIGR02117 family)